MLLYVHVLFWFTLMIFNTFNHTRFSFSLTHTLTHTHTHLLTHTHTHERNNVSNYIFWLKILRWRKNPKICSRLSQLISKMFTHRKGVHWPRSCSKKYIFSLTEKCCAMLLTKERRSYSTRVTDFVQRDELKKREWDSEREKCEKERDRGEGGGLARPDLL